MRKEPIFCIFFSLVLFFGGLASSPMVFAMEFSDNFETSDDSGVLRQPSGIVFDSSTDYLYVADTGNDRIVIIDVNGNCDSGDDEYFAEDICFVEEFETSDDSGSLSDPSGLALDTGKDYLYVADTGNDRIVIIDVNGNCDSGDDEYFANDICFVEEFETSDDSGSLSDPSGLALDTGKDYLYVADTTNDRIVIIDVEGNCDSGDDEYFAEDICFVEEFETSDDSGSLSDPSGLALDTGTDYLYVADTTNDRIVIIDVEGNCDSGDDEYFAEDICFVEEFETSDDSGSLSDPSGLDFDTSTNYLYVADTTNDRIVIIDVNGNCDNNDDEYFAEDICFVEELGSLGDDDDELDEPSYLVRNVDEDLVYVSDTGNDRIQIIEISGSSSSTDAPSRPTGLEAYPISKTSIFITWDVGDPDEDITGYKIEAREGTDDYEVLVSNTGNNANSFVHRGLSSSETYTYRVYAINAQGTSSVSSTASEKPEDSQAPAAFSAIAISDSKIKLSWFPPTDTFNQSISGYVIERVITTGVYDIVADVGSQTTTYTVSNLQTDKEYTFAVRAEFGSSGSPRSNTASATPTEDAVEPASSSITTPSSPNLSTSAVSENQVNLSWSKPSDGGSSITGYKIEVKENSGSYTILVENTGNDSRSYSHTNLTPNTKYTYKVSAINGIGVGASSNESSATPADTPEQVLAIKPLGRLSIDEGKRLSFIVGVMDSSIDNIRYSLANNAPSGASISSSSGSFTWTPSKSQSGTYTFDVIAKTGSLEDRESITITVNDVPDTEPQEPEEPKDEPKEPEEPKDLGIASFVDPTKDPQSYVDRYNNEPNYKEWFDENYPEYDSIYQAVGLEEPKGIAVFVDPTKDPQSYVDRYNNEPNYKEWFDENYPEYDSIYQAVGLEEPKVEEPKIGECGEGTKLVDGVCTPVKQPKEGGGCLIATAAYGSEMAPQVQFLREIRDNKVMSTESGASFMSGFNEFYYSFSPAIADYERENPAFKEAVKLGLTPMLTSLSLLSAVDIDSEQEMLGYGIAIILANVGMYFAAPAILVYGIKKSRLVKF